MANSTFSNLSDRASGTFSGIRNRLSGQASRGQGRYSDGYDDYAYNDYQDYGEYAYGADAPNPYDDIDDASGIGEVRTRAASSSSRRYHPPLLSFNEARVNTYVPDHLLRDPLERTGRTGSRAAGANAGAGYTPRVRDSVNVGRAAEYDFAEDGALTSPAGVAEPAAPLDGAGGGAGAGAGAGGAAGASTPAAAASPYDPFASFQGTGAATHMPTRKLKLITPVSYGEVESVARALKAGDVVVLGLTRTPGELAKRLLDFSFGVASALDARVDCVADKVFVVSRGHGLTESERLSLHDQGIIL